MQAQKMITAAAMARAVQFDPRRPEEIRGDRWDPNSARSTSLGYPSTYGGQRPPHCIGRPAGCRRSRG